MGGGEGKKKKKKESKKAARQPSAELQPEPAAEAGGIRDWPDDDDDDDRWGSECFKCGQDGDLLCCEVRACLGHIYRLYLYDGCRTLSVVGSLLASGLERFILRPRVRQPSSRRAIQEM